MHIGLILTKTTAEEGYNTFLKFLNFYAGNDDVSIYLLGNGVYCLRKQHPKSGKIVNLLKDSNKTSKIYACLDDLNARGISVDNMENEIQIFSCYDEIVIDIMENMDQILSF